MEHIAAADILMVQVRDSQDHRGPLKVPVVIGLKKLACHTVEMIDNISRLLESILST